MGTVGGVMSCANIDLRGILDFAFVESVYVIVFFSKEVLGGFFPKSSQQQSEVFVVRVFSMVLRWVFSARMHSARFFRHTTNRKKVMVLPFFS